MKYPSVLCRIQLELTGDVQGIGLRPQLALLADKYQLAGFVANVNDVVVLEVQGSKAAVDGFYHDLIKLASFCEIHVYKEAIPVLEVSGFEIQPSKHDFAEGVSETRPSRLVRFPGDQAVCSTCVDELFLKESRRYGYGFTSCAQCGPRYSVMTAVPYDRERTGFSGFPLCELCQQEYGDFNDRRYHAETISCAMCGPRWQLSPYVGDLTSDMALANVVAKRLIGSDIMCVQGISGFHLLVNALDSQAVQTLRKRKQRPRKPFALMMKNIEMVRMYCQINNEEVAALLSSRAPLVLLKKRLKLRLPKGGNAPYEIAHEIINDVAPDNPYLAVMLPSTPMQHLLFHSLDIPLVATSANRSGEPIEYEPASAKENLALVADGFLWHNLHIENPQDDSVVHFIVGKQTVLRRGRGYGLVPETAVEKSVSGYSQDVVVLSVGGHVKNTIALGMLDQVVLSPHIGDLDTLASTRRYQQTIERFCEQQGVIPSVYIRDFHPQYCSSEVAERSSALLNSHDTEKVGHHFSHALACRF
ncbi:MAG: Sua5/YciO/YrdC/YwlC family protein, partial [Pseudomonadales bacterium]|nr:Sua5/YciO/YrdC/YwlC family protein [Pseudomonadales bacterium]